MVGAISSLDTAVNVIAGVSWLAERRLPDPFTVRVRFFSDGDFDVEAIYRNAVHGDGRHTRIESLTYSSSDMISNGVAHRIAVRDAETNETLESDEVIIPHANSVVARMRYRVGDSPEHPSL